MRLKPFFYRKYFAVKEYCSLLRAGYKKQLLLLDSIYFFCYLFHNPFEMARSSQGEGNIYGETPFSLLKKIGEKTGLQPNSQYLELGSGRGKGVFFMHIWFGCFASGIEWVEPFVTRACGIKALFSFPKVTFAYGDMKRASFEKVDVVYVYSTCFSEKELQNLAERASELKTGAYIVTVSAPLYPKAPHLEYVERFLAQFPWGKGIVYIQQKID